MKNQDHYLEEHEDALKVDTFGVHYILYSNSHTVQRTSLFRRYTIELLRLLDHIVGIKICPGLDSSIPLFDPREKRAGILLNC